MRLRADVAR